MGHTAGVLNNLERFSANPVFLTTQKIPNLDSRISLHEIFLEKQFRNFDTILLLESSALIFNEALSKRGDLSFSFIYQRYSDYNYSGALIAEKFKIPLVLEFNCPAIWTAKHWAKGLSYEKLANEVEMVNVRLADVVVVVSQPLKNELVSRGVDSDKILVNPNGVDPEIYSPGVDGSEIRRKYNLEGRTVIGFIGTFGKWHGAEVLAEAFGLLLRQYPQSRDTTRLLMIGDGYTMSEVKRQLEVNGVTPESILTGIVPQEEGPAHLAACDLLASPHVLNPDGTPFFGSPTKLFEYMAMGKGIVASDLDQIGEVLQHDHTGWLVKPGDAESLMHGLKFLIDNPETRQRMAEAAQREVVDKYTWKEHTRKIIEKLKERCSNR
ncbi:MAG: glycosyltransferase family 4 protein [Nitrospinae bacterium]|nr:glycosyltransferase family 4 protein [Nitrospinota bacterium]